MAQFNYYNPPRQTLADAIQSGMQFKAQRDEMDRINQIRDLTQQASSGGLGSDAFKQLRGLDVDQANKLAGLLNTDMQGLDAAMEDFAVAKTLFSSDPSGQRAVEFLSQRSQLGQSMGRDMSHTNRLIADIQADPKQAFMEIDEFLNIPNMLKTKTSKTADIQTFENLLEQAGLDKEDAKLAARIKLGLDPRATGSADITIAKKDLAKEVAEAKATIKQSEKFAEMTGASRAKAIDSGFEKIGKINSNISNINRAIQLIDEGAGTGAVEKFLPSVKAATVELVNLRNQLGLDVVGATTFGALSKGELDLALDTALPTGLDEPELKDYLIRKRDAQEKLREHFKNQIEFFDQGGTKAGFLRMQKRGASNTIQQEPEITPIQPLDNEFKGFKVIR